MQPITDNPQLSAVEDMDLLDLDLTIVESDDASTMAAERVRAGGATSTCTTYWSASRCPSCW
ncbi:hypothetical protein [Stackebrandtia soli]|uniref:hypothetical protein n=1 Tax=Stackebrandtia soli TaxID=1892856 RepID=UPI0039E8A584